MTASVSVIIPTYNRGQTLLETLERILKCDPRPSEILVHVDEGDITTVPLISNVHESVKIYTAETRQGPGGGRNRLLPQCQCETIVSLDDDSYPIDEDFFARVPKVFAENPSVGVVAMKITHDDEQLEPRMETRVEVADFVGCGCAYRRSAIANIDGYVPLQPAYGMEEVDVALQVADRGYSIVLDHDLRIRHATDRTHQTSIDIVSAHIKNTMLLAFARYPRSLLGLGTLQYLNRVLYSLKRGHLLGLLKGVIETPIHVWKHRGYRSPVKRETVLQLRQLRRIT